MEKNLLIIGAGSLGAIAKEIAEEIAEEMGTFQKIDFLDDDSDLAIGKFSDIERFAGEYRSVLLRWSNGNFDESTL